MSATASQSDADETPSKESPDSVSKTQRLRSYLTEQVQQEEEIYVKSKFIASDVGLSPKEIGARMAKLQDSASALEIEKWSYTSATTWRITTTATA
jgi:CRP-like cAMP-binding protein